MSSQRNKKKGGKKGKNASPSDNSPPVEENKDASPTTSARTFEDEGNQDPPPREFQEQSYIREEPQEPAEAVVSSEAAGLYNEVVRTPQEPVPAEAKEAGLNEQQGSPETESILPVVAAEVAPSPDDDSGNFFKSFFVCCVGRK